MNVIRYMIKYLPYLLVNFQTAIYKKPTFWQNVDHFKNVEPTTIYLIKRLTSTTENLLFSRESS